MGQIAGCNVPQTPIIAIFAAICTYSGANPFNIPAVRRVPNGGKKHLFGIRLFA